MTIIVKKIGLSFTPSPSLLLLYTEQGKARRREMPLRDLEKEADCQALVSRLRLRHKKHLASVPEVRLERLLMLAKESLKGKSLAEALQKVDNALKIDPSEDLNKLSDSELQRRKDIMDLQFSKSNIGKNHPDFVYDKEVEFDEEKMPGGWDNDSENEEKEEEEITPRNKDDSPQLSAPEKGADGEEEDDFW